MSEQCECPYQKALMQAKEDARAHRSEAIHYTELEARLAALATTPCPLEQENERLKAEHKERKS